MVSNPYHRVGKMEAMNYAPSTVTPVRIVTAAIQTVKKLPLHCITAGGTMKTAVFTSRLSERRRFDSNDPGFTCTERRDDTTATGHERR
jgi:hypothetical protein